MARHGGRARIFVLAFFFVAPITNFTAPGKTPARSPGVRRSALVSQTVRETLIELPKSHLAGALQRAMGRNEVYKSEMLFFHRTDQHEETHFALLRIPALPKKKPDGTNYIPERPFAYFEGRAKTREDAENVAARKALEEVRKADTEITRWLSWTATTSQQALELAAAEIADARPTDGFSRKWMSKALAKFHRRRVRKFEMPFYMREDSESYHAVLALPWRDQGGRAVSRRKFYFEGIGLEAKLAKESACEAAFKVLSALTGVKRKSGPPELTKPLRQIVSNEQVTAKKRLHQLLEYAMRRTGREFVRRRDVVYRTRPVVNNDTELLLKVWESNMTEVILKIPPLDNDSEPLSFSIRVPAWNKAQKKVGLERRFAQARQSYWDAKDRERKAYIEAQEAVAAAALKELLSMPLALFEEQERELEQRRLAREDREQRRQLPQDAADHQEAMDAHAAYERNFQSAAGQGGEAEAAPTPVLEGQLAEAPETAPELVGESVDSLGAAVPLPDS